MLRRLASRFGPNNPSKVRDRNIVLTGPGRSGTTLTCYLLNKLPNTVALSEPISPGRYADRMPDHEAVVDGIEEFYRNMRVMALQQGHVISKHVGGKVPDNSKGIKDGVRQRIAEKGRIPVGKELAPDFYLAIKQPAMFTALLPALVKRFPCFAIIRNPLAIMLSASSVHRTTGPRKSPRAKAMYDPKLGERLQKNKREGAEKVGQRLLRLHYTFERYKQFLPESHVLRYEDICDSRGRALEVIVPDARHFDEALANKNLNPLYPRKKVLYFGEKLLESEGAYWDYYTRESVREIMEGFE